MTSIFTRPALASNPKDRASSKAAFNCGIGECHSRSRTTRNTAASKHQTSTTPRHSNLVTFPAHPISTMRHSALLLLLAAVGLAGCGAGHANLTSISVSPESATASSNQGQVGYTATGNFANGKSRELSQADGLSWKTSPTPSGSVAATIGSTGEVTCSAPGTITITASAPENLQFTINNGIQNTSTTISGTASLTCQ